MFIVYMLLIGITLIFTANEQHTPFTIIDNTLIYVAFTCVTFINAWHLNYWTWNRHRECNIEEGVDSIL